MVNLKKFNAEPSIVGALIDMERKLLELEFQRSFALIVKLGASVKTKIALVKHSVHLVTPKIPTVVKLANAKILVSEPSVLVVIKFVCPIPSNVWKGFVLKFQNVSSTFAPPDFLFTMKLLGNLYSAVKTRNVMAQMLIVVCLKITVVIAAWVMRH